MDHIQESTFQFLRELRENNNREWFADNKTRFEETKTNIKAFANVIADEISSHDEIEKTKVYRIYRDVRFSKDKTPYKTALSGFFVRATALRRGGYYFHIEPDNVFLGGGFWNPNSADLKRMRQEIEAEESHLRELLNDPTFVKTFGGLQGNAVKTAPKGFSKESSAIDLLRFKQYLLSQQFDEKEALQSGFAKKISDGYKVMRSFFDFMSTALTTDLNGELIV